MKQKNQADFVTDAHSLWLRFYKQKKHNVCVETCCLTLYTQTRFHSVTTCISALKVENNNAPPPHSVFILFIQNEDVVSAQCFCLEQAMFKDYVALFGCGHKK